MSLSDQWRAIERALPADWVNARLTLLVADDAKRDRAAALLGPLQPGRARKEIRFAVGRRGFGPGVEMLRRLLARLDAEGIRGTLQLLGTAETAPAPAEERERRSLAAAWDEALADLPEDWSDLHCELELISSDHLDPAALLLAPVNPLRYGSTPGFRFRVARSFGYGASPQMARRCLARLDENGIPGALRILRVLCDTRPAETQGPVWYVEGKVV